MWNTWWSEEYVIYSKVEDSSLRDRLLIVCGGIGHWQVKGEVYITFTMLSFFCVYTAASLRVLLCVSYASRRVP